MQPRWQASSATHAAASSAHASTKAIGSVTTPASVEEVGEAVISKPRSSYEDVVVGEAVGCSVPAGVGDGVGAPVKTLPSKHGMSSIEH